MRDVISRLNDCCQWQDEDALVHRLVCDQCVYTAPIPTVIRCPASFFSSNIQPNAQHRRIENYDACHPLPPRGQRFLNPALAGKLAHGTACKQLRKLRNILK